MREIKFKAWDAEKGILSECLSLYFEREEVSFKIDRRVRKLKDVELMQSTGLKDKNGKEIYEGDIVKRNWETDGSLNEGNDIFVCELKDQRWLHKIDVKEWSDIFEDKDEIIGNIYENPELLTESKGATS